MLLAILGTLSDELTARAIEAVASRRVLSVEGGANSAFGPLITRADAEELIRTSSLDYGWVQQVKGGATRPLAGTNDRSVDLDAVLRSYQAGFTIRLTAVHRRSRTVAHTCKGLEDALAVAGCSLSRGVIATYTRHHHSREALALITIIRIVLVVQCFGEKHWTLFRNRAGLASKAQNQAPDERLPEPL